MISGERKAFRLCTEQCNRNLAVYNKMENVSSFSSTVYRSQNWFVGTEQRPVICRLTILWDSQLCYNVIRCYDETNCCLTSSFALKKEVYPNRLLETRKRRKLMRTHSLKCFFFWRMSCLLAVRAEISIRDKDMVEKTTKDTNRFVYFWLFLAFVGWCTRSYLQSEAISFQTRLFTIYNKKKRTSGGRLRCYIRSPSLYLFRQPWTIAIFWWWQHVDNCFGNISPSSQKRCHASLNADYTHNAFICMCKWKRQSLSHFSLYGPPLRL